MATLVLDTTRQGTQWKRWIDNVKEDLHQRGSNVPQVLKCVIDRKRQRKSVHAAPSSATYRKTDGQRKRFYDNVLYKFNLYFLTYFHLFSIYFK